MGEEWLSGWIGVLFEKEKEGGGGGGGGGYCELQDLKSNHHIKEHHKSDVQMYLRQSFNK